MEKFEKIHNKIKFRAFGKVTIGCGQKGPKESTANTADLFEEQERRAAEEIEDIKKAKKGKVGRVWEVRKKVIGGKKAILEATAIVNPKTKKLVVNRNEIKEVTLQYCQDTLANNKPEPEFEQTINDKKEMVKNILNEKDGEFEATEDTFNQLVSKFKKSGKRNYDFLTKAGADFQNVVFKFCRRMISEEKFPSSFNETILHMIFKGGKGKREILPDNRFIHSKPWFPRTVEGLVVAGGLKAPLVEGSSRFQIGGQSGHRVEEMIFTMKSVIAKYRAEGKMVILQCYDLEKFFDKEMTEDAVLTCVKRNADPKAVRCWFKLNEETTIKVRTGVGVTNQASVGSVIGQGTIGGALVSQAVLDEGIREQFTPGGPEELSYGGVDLAPLLFQDDFLHGAEGLPQAREANRKVNIMVKQRALGLNSKKSVCIVIGSKKQRKEITSQLKENPLMCGKVETKETESDKWLGQYLSAGGLGDSVMKTIAAKEGKIRGACLEIANIVEDWRAQAVGGIDSALILWEACCVPSILSGAGTWTEITPAAVKRLEALQHWFLRLILRVGPGCPVASLRWETGLLSMELRVWIEKLMLVRHIRSLGEGTLARMVYEEQKKNKWPGLSKEATKICDELGIQDVNEENTNKEGNQVYRKNVTQKCKDLDEARLRVMAEGKGKCARIMEGRYEKKPYMSNQTISKVRQYFYTRVKMQPFGGNYSKDKRFSKTEWMCRCAEDREEESHLLSGNCSVYGDLREKYNDLESDENLVKFFSEVLARRESLEEAEREERGLAAGRTTADSASP
jgi:hypothetical protein